MSGIHLLSRLEAFFNLTIKTARMIPATETAARRFGIFPSSVGPLMSAIVRMSYYLPATRRRRSGNKFFASGFCNLRELQRSICGCLLGVPLSIVILRFLIQLAPIDVPRLADAHIDFQALAFELALALLSALLVGGLFPSPPPLAPGCAFGCRENKCRSVASEDS